MKNVIKWIYNIFCAIIYLIVFTFHCILTTILTDLRSINNKVNIKGIIILLLFILFIIFGVGVITQSINKTEVIKYFLGSLNE